MKKFNRSHKLWIRLAALLVLSTMLFGCEIALPVESGTEAQTPTDTQQSVILHQVSIQEDDLIYMQIGDTLQLHTDAPENAQSKLTWSASNGCVAVTQNGLITAQAYGEATVTVSIYSLSDSITVRIADETTSTDEPDDPTDTGNGNTAPEEPENPPSEPVTPPNEEEPSDTPDKPQEAPLPSQAVIIEAERSPDGYEPADSYEEAVTRTQNGQLSGYPYVPDQAPNISEYRPMENGKYIKNNEPYYADENTYVVVDAYGLEVFRVYRGGAYITLEEVAAYVYAFGDVPANHSTSKNTKPIASIWGEYLRVNHTKFSGNTSRYPYEPALPRISGCGGDLTYYEMDIGTTGTDCDPSYPVATYNTGSSITRGAARIVYARFDANGNSIIDPDEKYVFYTYNHYNDFQEYLNYYGGWGEMFGNITGGGTISSRYDYNPTDYVPVVCGSLADRAARILPTLCTEPIIAAISPEAIVLFYDFRKNRLAA